MRSFLQVRSSDRNDPLFRERYLHMPNFAAFLLKLSQLYPDMFENTHVSVGSYLGFLEIPAISLEHFDDHLGENSQNCRRLKLKLFLCRFHVH